MTDETTTKKKMKGQAESGADPVRVIRHGAIAASIWQRQSPSGFAYFDFTLSRSWKSKAEKTGYSKSFFGTNKDQLLAAITEAAEWIAANSQEQAGDGTDLSVMAA